MFWATSDDFSDDVISRYIYGDDGSKRRVFLPAISLLVLTACEPEKPELFPDYCEKQQRTIPANERYRSVLLDILKDQDKLIEKFGSTGVHFFTYRKSYLEKQPDTSDVEIADSYIAEFPDCCRMTLPYYYLEMTKRSADDMYDSYQTGDWVKDVFVLREIPKTDEIYGEFRRSVSDCGKYIRKNGSAI